MEMRKDLKKRATNADRCTVHRRNWCRRGETTAGEGRRLKRHEVAAISRLLKIIGLFCRIQSLL